MAKQIISLVLFLFIFSHNSMAQKIDPYSTLWKNVEKFETKGLTKSAWKEVNNIYKKAQKDNNDAQQIKACMYMIRYRSMVEEDSKVNNIFFVDTLIRNAKVPAKNILQSMQGQMYWQYIQNNRYKIYSRTELKEEKSNDIETWSLAKLNKTASQLYHASLTNELILKATKLNEFDPIIIKGENTRHLRPTLYDFLTHRALQYFVNDESYIIKPSYRFELNEEAIYTPAKTFCAATFKSNDTTSNHLVALQLFQNILSFHLNDENPDALIDAELNRLQFVNQYAILTNKEMLYELALKQIEDNYPNNEQAARAMYNRSMIYYNRGLTYSPNGNTDHQYELKRAKDLCEKAYKQFPKSEGGINCRNLINRIVEPTLSLHTEKVNVPNQPFRSLVQYKNVPTLYVRIIKTNKEELKEINQIKEYAKRWEKFTSLKSFTSQQIQLPNLNDYQQHATEIKIDKLNKGIYIILAGTKENFSLENNVITKQITYVSAISYINQANNYYVVNRETGLPIDKATIQVWEQKYDYQKSEYTPTKAESYTSDKNGFFLLKNKTEYRNILLQVKTSNDELFTDDNHYDHVYNSYEQEEVEEPETFLFTDRSIYRPGQTVYFKGIVVEKNKYANKSKVVSGFSSNVKLMDANNQLVKEVHLTTNEYGSYNGSFKLPEGVLNGDFTIEDATTVNSKDFKVEEYKRPKFFTEIKKPTGTYRLFDSVSVIGNAKAYAGNNIDGAKVTYRVVRKVRFPIWWGWGRTMGKRSYPYAGYEEMEITNGESITDSKGEFSIRFKAIPDERIDKKNQPTFYYEVSADVTDLNGETRSGETSIAVSYQALQLNINLPEKINADSLNNLLISSKNTNDLFEKATVDVSIQKVESPKKIFRTRYWDAPDQFIMSKEEYYSYFPYDLYDNENEMTSWKIAEKVLNVSDTTSENNNFKIQNPTLKSGWYKIIATTKDKYGEEVRAEKYIQIINTKEKNKLYQPIQVQVKKTTLEPGEKIEYSIKTGLDNVWMIHTISKMNEQFKTDYPSITASKDFENIVPVTENDRGGITMNYAFVQHNRIYQGTEGFNVPWNNKELKITYETFREKILPGSTEKYSVKISGYKGEKIAGEILASMYDASLDQFAEHSWQKPYIWPSMNSYFNWQGASFNQTYAEEFRDIKAKYLSSPNRSYDQLLFTAFGNDNIRLRGGVYKTESAAMDQQTKAVAAMSMKENLNEVVVMGYGSVKKKDVTGSVTTIKANDAPSKTPSPKEENIQIRKNFNETAFFFPDLKTDSLGNVSFSFSIPEALTKWKLMTLAHTKDVSSVYAENFVVTQKPLMVQPNAPRFMREGDKMEFSAKIVNLESKALSGSAILELIDANTNKPVDGWFKNVFPVQYFTAEAGQSTVVKFPIDIPVNYNSAILYRIKANAQIPDYQSTASFSDGEEMALPVLTNRMLVTESLPINVRKTNKKEVVFDKLLYSNSSAALTTLTHHALTVEYTSNPIWYAVQALPYLMEYPYECAEQTFNRYYANTLASFITRATPKIKSVFDKWKNIDSAALVSNLEKNEELKSALLQETPWVLDAKNESQQKKNIALLFDMVKLSSEGDKAVSKLKELQSPNGGFVWFKGGPDDRYITQYILTGIGHIKKLNAITNDDYQKIKPIVDLAIPYLDKKIREEYDQLLRSKAKMSDNHLGYTAVQYLYMRTFFTEYKISASTQTAFTYYRNQSKKYWLSNSKYMQAMIALSLHRNDDKITPKNIIKSLKENSINKEEMGMYWKDMAAGGYYWYQAPIESQAMMIEAFTDIDKDANTIDDLKTWLLKQKQTQNWKTTKATAEACYALLLGGSNWMSEEKEVTITLGTTVLKSTDIGAEAGTGYFKKRIEGDDVKPNMGNISVEISPQNPSTSNRLNPTSTSWGSVYWQYFEDLDKITPAKTPLQLNKRLFVEKNSDKGPILEEITFGYQLKVGDKIKVRIELKADRDMEYVHMKDMRAACMEPVNVISGYKWQGGLGYYESTKDASTNFFFGWLPRGTYVFEYPMFVTHTGNFSNGITSIQCMYAPEFTSHSEGIRVTVE